jgi:hypothetical protein
VTSLRISARERRTLTLGALLIGGLVAASWGVPSWLAWQRQARASAVELRAEVVRAEASLAALPQTLDSLEQRRQRFISLAPMLVGGDSPAAAAAALASLLSGAAAQAHVRLGATQVYVDSAYSGVFTRVGVRGDATGDIRGVAALLSELEQGPKLLIIRGLSISQSEPGATADRPEALRVEFAVEGLALHRRAGEAK